MKTATKQRMYRLRYWNKDSAYIIERRIFENADAAYNWLTEKDFKILDVTYLAN